MSSPTFVRGPGWPAPGAWGSGPAGAGHCFGSGKRVLFENTRGMFPPTISLAFSRAELSAFQAMTGSPTYLASSRKYWLATVSLNKGTIIGCPSIHITMNVLLQHNMQCIIITMNKWTSTIRIQSCTYSFDRLFTFGSQSKSESRNWLSLLSPAILLAVGDVDHTGDVLAQELIADLAQYLYNKLFIKDVILFHCTSVGPGIGGSISRKGSSSNCCCENNYMYIRIWISLYWAGTVNSSREYLLAAENIFFWYSLPLKNEWGMTTATLTLDLFCPAPGPGPGLEHGKNKPMLLNYLLCYFPLNTKSVSILW